MFSLIRRGVPVSTYTNGLAHKSGLSIHPSMAMPYASQNRLFAISTRAKSSRSRMEVPETLSLEVFCKQIGGDCEQVADKFDSMEEIFNLTSVDMRRREIPVR